MRVFASSKPCTFVGWLVGWLQGCAYGWVVSIVLGVTVFGCGGTVRPVAMARGGLRTLTRSRTRLRGDLTFRASIEAWR